MTSKMTTATGIHGLLSDPRVLRSERPGQTWYSAVAIVQVLTELEDAAELWDAIRQRESALRQLSKPVEFQIDADSSTVIADGLEMDGVLRLIQSVRSQRAERLKRWLIDSAIQRLEEAEDPELALLRARRLYEDRGFSRRWIDKRLRGISARHELTSEWYRRGARQSDDYRRLTNELIKASFGMDIEAYRQHKSLESPNENLRDHMTDLELALTTLAETTAAVLHRERNSNDVHELDRDVIDAGQIVASTREQIERQTGHPVDSGGAWQLARASPATSQTPSPSADARFRTAAMTR